MVGVRRVCCAGTADVVIGILSAGEGMGIVLFNYAAGRAGVVVNRAVAAAAFRLQGFRFLLPLGKVIMKALFDLLLHQHKIR